MSAVRDPRTAIGSVRHRVRVRVIRKIRRRSVILFQRHAGIGDIICTFPTVLALRDRHPDAIFVYSVWKAFKSIVEMGKVADYVAEMDWSTETPKVVARDYDKSYQPWLEDEQPRGRKHVHLVDDFAQTLNVTLKSRQPRLYVPAPLSRLARARLSSFRTRTKYIFGIHVGPSWRVREWATGEWSRLVVLLRENFNCTVIQLGLDASTGAGPIKAPRIQGAEDWVGRLGLDETVAVLERVNLLIGIDSGLLHAAGAVGTPTVGLFGAVDPRLRLPPETPSLPVTSGVPCLACHHRLPRVHWQEGCPNDVQCMTDISPDAVLTAINQLLSANEVPVTPISYPS